jgi:hypothetical protein
VAEANSVEKHPGLDYFHAVARHASDFSIRRGFDEHEILAAGSLLVMTVIMVAYSQEKPCEYEGKT